MDYDFELDPPPTPVQVREWVADLFRQDRINLAVALAEAGLALYPDSEDVLVIAALVSEVQQDWAYSRQLLEHLIQIQAGQTPAEVWHHYARVLRWQRLPAPLQSNPDLTTANGRPRRDRRSPSRAS